MEPKTYTVDEIKEVLALHKKWWDDEEGGKRADLQGADLRGADLRGAYLRGAYLQGADLRGADLRGAYLQRADLQGAYLQGADLRGAYLQRADLRGAYLQGAYLRGAKYGKDDEDELLVRYFTVGPIGSRLDYLQVFMTNKRVELRTGCFAGGIEEFVTAVNNDHAGDTHGHDYLAAVEFIKVMVQQ